MTPDELRELISGGEKFHVEFKGEEREQLHDESLVEAVVCLSNRPGLEPAWLLIGVEKDGRVTGARPRHGRTTDPRRIQALIANRTRPSVTCRVQVLELDGKPVVVVEVPASRLPVGTSSGRYLRRATGARGEPICLPMSFHEIQSLEAARSRLDYSALSVPDATWDDLDPLEFERFRRMIRESRGAGDSALVELPDHELVKALCAVEDNSGRTVLRVLALLLFGKEEALGRLVPTREIAFQVLAGARVEANQFFRWPLLRVMEELRTQFRARNREQGIQGRTSLLPRDLEHFGIRKKLEVIKNREQGA